ncbi:SHOCT domain-containing protein [Francisellaceae bacterium]|jgi:hypothetical protein|nr:SHOCT domain-containing protein [Francisellaceae bacterium]
MRKLTQQSQQAINDIANRYGLSQDAVLHMLDAVIAGGGTMAQFNCPELGGGGQWMQGGMTMVGDMFNNGLKATVDNLCSELANLTANQQVYEQPAKSQNQGSGFQMQGGNNWWPEGLGSPNSTGGQNNTRYAYFGGSNRLAVDINGQVTVYDTLDHQIGGVSQQQGSNNSMTFTSQYGTVNVSSLPVVDQNGNSQAQNQPQQNQPSIEEPQQSFNPEPVQSAPESNQSGQKISTNEVISLLEQLGKLKEIGVLTDAEFNNKKADLLGKI